MEDSSERLLELALRNPVENAVEHADAATQTVEVSADLDPERTFPLRVDVVDDGPGIPEEEMSVFERGSETPLKHGSGLGLWVVKWVMTELGGELDVQGRGDRGTRITLWFPRATRCGTDERP